MNEVPEQPVPPPEPPPPLEPAAPVVRKRRGPSLVWVVPALAALIGAWLWFDALRQRGPEVIIEFSTAEGLEAGRTKIKFKSVEVGLVEAVEIKPDLSGVLVTAQMERSTEPLFTEGTRFWVERPRVGLGGVSGLSTLLSGAFIAVDPGQGDLPVERFIGLDDPPQAPAETGLKLRLRAQTLGSLAIGSPVYYLGVVVGRVEGFRFSQDSAGLDIDIHVEGEYAHLVRTNSRFWNASGVDISFGAEGFKFAAASLESLVAGGVEFAPPEDAAPADTARSGATYRLYRSRAEADADLIDALECALYFPGSVRGLGVGAPVEFRGIRFGSVRRVALEFEPLEQALTRVTVALEPRRLNVELPDEAPAGMHHMALVDAGLRARLAQASLLTGALLVELVMLPDTPATLAGAPGELEIPTVPSQVDAIKAVVEDLPHIVADVRRTIAALADVVTQMGQQSSLQVRVAEALEELTQTLRSVRQLTDLLERQPDALLWGREEDK
jgi:paraquat-inducible protein B